MQSKTRPLAAYILPAMGGLFVTYLYNAADGIFVGQGVGAAALGAVNIGVPFITFVVAAAALFPMGGAAVCAVRMGRADTDGANRAFMTAVMLTFAVSLLLTAAGMFFAQPIADLSGAKKLSTHMRAMAGEYLFYYSAFSVPMLMSTCLSVFVRNDGAPTLAFLGMCTGAVMNIFLDWLFIFPLKMGVIGAAVASGLGQISSVLILLSHFIRKKGKLQIRIFKPELSLIHKICIRGVPEAVTQLTTPVTALCYNLMLSRLSGDIGVAAFSVLSFIYSLANAILSGTAQGLQPLWGYCYGRQDTKEIHWYFRCGIGINGVLSLLMYAALYMYAVPVIGIFNRDTELVRTASAALPLFGLQFIPMALNLIYTAFLFSTKRTKAAAHIAVSRGVVVKALAICCFPLFSGSNAIWLAPFAAELITLAYAVRLKRSAGLRYM